MPPTILFGWLEDDYVNAAAWLTERDALPPPQSFNGLTPVLVLTNLRTTYWRESGTKAPPPPVPPPHPHWLTPIKRFVRLAFEQARSSL